MNPQSRRSVCASSWANGKLSYRPGRLSDVYHPWRRFRALARWTLQQADLPEGVHGQLRWSTRTVTLDRRLSQVQRRCTIAHELVHIERGPVPCSAWLAEREEAAVEQEVARRLIKLKDLGEALAWARHASEAADVLWVTEDVLRVRLEHLHPAERAYLKRRMEFRHEAEEVVA